MSINCSFCHVYLLDKMLFSCYTEIKFIRFSGGIWVVLFVFGTICSEGSLLIASAVAAVFIEVGVILQKVRIQPSIIQMIIAGLVFIISNIVHIFFLHKTIEFSSGLFGVMPLFVVSSIAGSWLLINISMFIKQNTLLEFIGKNSLLYYGIHYLVLSVVGFVVAKIIQYQTVAESLIFAFTLFGKSVLVLMIMKWLQVREKWRKS